MQQELKYPGANRKVNTYLMGMCLRVNAIFEKRFQEGPTEYFVYLNFRACEVLNLSYDQEFLVSYGTRVVYAKTTSSSRSIEDCYIVANIPGDSISRQAVFYSKEPEEEEEEPETNSCIILR